MLVEGQTAIKFGEIYQKPELSHMLENAYTENSNYKKIFLPARAPVTLALDEAIRSRRSDRSFTGRPISLEVVATLLQLSSGVTGTMQTATGSQQRLRAVASGGALYPIESYVIANRVDGLRPEGIYHYLPRRHALEDTGKTCFVDQQVVSFPGAEPMSVRNAAAVFAFTGLFVRTTYKYGDRGYRIVLFEAGAICSHLSLVAQGLGLGSYQLSGFYDNVLNSWLGVDGCNEAALNVVVVGTKEEAP